MRISLSKKLFQLYKHRKRGTSESDLSFIWLLAPAGIPISRLDGGIDHNYIDFKLLAQVNT